MERAGVKEPSRAQHVACHATGREGTMMIKVLYTITKLKSWRIICNCQKIETSTSFVLSGP